MQLGDYIQLWYKTYKEPYHEITTRNVQWTYIRVHIQPSQIGQMQISQITAYDIQNFFNELLDHGNKSKLLHGSKKGKGLSAWTVKKIRSLLINAFNYCIKDNLRNDNPVIETSNISIPKIKYEPFSLAQQKLFLKKQKNIG